MTTTKPVTDNWKKEWFEIEDAACLNTANHAAMPRVSPRAVQASFEAKRFPHHVDDSLSLKCQSAFAPQSPDSSAASRKRSR
jgi:maleate cis-trans isomerase